jgi:hypothetical protein
MQISSYGDTIGRHRQAVPRGNNPIAVSRQIGIPDRRQGDQVGLQALAFTERWCVATVFTSSASSASCNAYA